MQVVDSQYAKQYRDTGYFIVDDAVDSGILEDLEAALRRVVDKVRRGTVVDCQQGIRRDGPGAEPAIIWGLIAPEYDEPVFARYLGGKEIYRYLKCIIGEDLRLGWLTALAMESGGYEVGWHRDIGSEVRDGSYSVEMEILRRYRKNTVKWHLALIDDPCLWIVPGSHRRYRTAEEREILVNNPSGEIPDGQQIDLKRGQTVIWNGNTIHRGIMPAGMQVRMTLTGALVRHESQNSTETIDPRFRWMLAHNVRQGLPGSTRIYYDRWRHAVRA